MGVVVLLLAVVTATWLLRGHDPGAASGTTVARLEAELQARDAVIADLRQQLATAPAPVPVLVSEETRAERTEANAAPAPDAGAAARTAATDATIALDARESAALEWLRRVLGERFSLGDGTAATFLRTTTSLDLRGAPVTDADLAHLRAFPNLTSLELRGTKVTDAGLQHLAGLGKLEVLSLRGTAVKGFGLAALPVTLQHVDLTDTPTAGNGFHSLPPLPALSTLKLNRLPVTDAELEQLPRWPRLQHLEIDGTRVTPEGLRRLLAANPALARVEVRGLTLGKELEDELRRRYPNLDLVAADDVRTQFRDNYVK